VVQQRRRNTAAISELRDEYYNATITHFEPTHSDLWVLRVRPDHGETNHQPGQYASLGLGFWEDRIDDAEDTNLDDRWEKLIRRSYSISSRMFDEYGYLTDESSSDELEFYIVLVPPTSDNVPALTPRLALKRPGDRIYLGPKVAGRYTLDSVTDPESTVVFFSTGTGEAPQNAMVVELLRKGHSGPIVSAVSVRKWADLGYAEQHRTLERRYQNYHYLPLPTREDDIAKQYMQDVVRNEVFENRFGITLDPDRTNVFLCGNPSMIGLPEKNEAGEEEFPDVVGVVQLLTERGFTLDRRKQPGNVHYEEYW
jgi:ferredoxin--NADP+ reductase